MLSPTPGMQARDSIIQPHRFRVRLMAVALVLMAGCQAQRQAGQDAPRSPAPGGPAPGAPGPGPGGQVAAPGAPAEQPQPQERALVIENGQEKWIDAGTAQASGYTLIDLSDDFTPYIFAEQQDA